MSLSADINGHQFTVTPRGRLEALATRPSALRYTGSAIIAAAFAVLGTGYSVVSHFVSAPAGGVPASLLALALSLLALAVGVVVRRRLQALQRNPEAWTTPPTAGQDVAPAPWRVVLRVPKGAVLGTVALALLWVVGFFLMRSSAAPAQLVGGVAVIPGVVLYLLVKVACVWVMLAALIYMLWSLVPGRTARASS